MLIGFYFVIEHPGGKETVLAEVDAACAGAGFRVEIEQKHGFEFRHYRRSEREPTLSASYEFDPSWFAMAFHPIEAEHFAAYGAELLTQLFAALGIRTNVALGRTFGESPYGIIKREEPTSSLKFVDWYQYFSQPIVQRLGGIEFLKQGPFFKVEEYPNGASGVWLAPAPDQALGRQAAAKYLGIELPKVYGKNPRTGEPIEISWN